MKNQNVVNSKPDGTFIHNSVQRNLSGPEPKSYDNIGLEVSDRFDPNDYDGGLVNLGEEILREVERVKNMK